MVFQSAERRRLLTLKIAAQALQRDMVLKDASAYNVQFIGHRPVFIDTLSFEAYEEGTPGSPIDNFVSTFWHRWP